MLTKAGQARQGSAEPSPLVGAFGAALRASKALAGAGNSPSSPHAGGDSPAGALRGPAWFFFSFPRRRSGRAGCVHARRKAGCQPPTFGGGVSLHHL